MDYFAKEKLINFVKEHECIYDHRHTEYKNNVYKMQLWEHIGNDLNIEPNEAKQMWRTLRDGYTRHRKQKKGGNRSSRKYTHYMWSAQMTFLDDTLDLRSRNDTESPKSVVKASPGSPQTTDAPETKWQCISHSDSLKPASISSPEVTTLSLKRDINIAEEYVKAKHKREDDGVDHLFMSYAASFRRFSLRKQAELKVVLAKVFAEAELSELDNDEQDTSPMFNVSPDELSDGTKKEDLS